MFNAIYFRVKNAGTGVHLLQSVCVPLVMYAAEVLPLTKSYTSMSNHIIDIALCRIFGCGYVQDIVYIRTAVYLPCAGVTVRERFTRFLESSFRTFSWTALLCGAN